jgi:hypothetical protein
VFDEQVTGQQDQDRKHEKARRSDLDAAVVGDSFALAHIVDWNAGQSCDDLLQREVVAVALPPRIGGDRLFRLPGERAARAHFEPQCRREAFARRIAGLALSGNLQRLNPLCHVSQVPRESICNLGRIISRLRDVVAHLQEAHKYRQYRD